MKKLATTNPQGPLLLVSLYLEDIDLMSWMISGISNLTLISASFFKKKFKSKKSLSLFLDEQELEEKNMKLILEVLIKSKCVDLSILDDRILRLCTKFNFFDLAEEFINHTKTVDVTKWNYTCFFNSVKNSNYDLFTFLWYQLPKKDRKFTRDVLKSLINCIFYHNNEDMLIFLFEKFDVYKVLSYEQGCYWVGCQGINDFIKKSIDKNFDTFLRNFFREYVLKYKTNFHITEKLCDWISKKKDCRILYGFIFGMRRTCNE